MQEHHLKINLKTLFESFASRLIKIKDSQMALKKDNEGWFGNPTPYINAIEAAKKCETHIEMFKRDLESQMTEIQFEDKLEEQWKD